LTQHSYNEKLKKCDLVVLEIWLRTAEFGSGLKTEPALRATRVVNYLNSGNLSSTVKLNNYRHHYIITVPRFIRPTMLHEVILLVQPKGRSDTVLAALPRQDRPPGTLFQHRYAAVILYRRSVVI